MIGMIIVLIVAVVMGIGIAILFYRIAFPKSSERWIARCWHIGEGIRSTKKNISGDKILYNRRCKDLIPYCEDVIIKKEIKKTQSIVYYLKKLKTPINAVTGNQVSKWAGNRREVDVLIHNGQATVLNKAYDYETGEKLFEPMPLSTMEMIKTDIIIKQERRRRDKENVWEIIGRYGTYIFLGIVVILLGYMNIQKGIEVSDNYKEAVRIQANQQLKIAEINKDSQLQCLDYVNQRENNINKGNVNNNIEDVIPSIT